MKKSVESEVITVAEIAMTEMRFNVVGTSPLVPHAMSAKSKGSLLFPAPKKNQAEKDASMKHAPYEEFRDAAYKFQDNDNQPTRLYMPGASFHSAVAAVAVDMAGARKAQIGRLTSLPVEKIAVFGVPQIWCTVVRSSDMARTPDVRTLPILPKWAATFTVEFVASLIKEQSIANLLAAAGVIIGIGDGRPQKGKLAMGRFRLCSDNDAEFKKIVATGGRGPQDAALVDPVPYDVETQQLLAWFEDELKRRTAAPIAASRKVKVGMVSPNPNGREAREGR